MTTLDMLEKFMVTEVAVDLGKKTLEPDEDLLGSGIIDSLGIMKLVVFMEDNLGIKVGDDEIIPENFQTLNDMVKFVEQKMQKR
jgi:acyl carrier protein